VIAAICAQLIAGCTTAKEQSLRSEISEISGRVEQAQARVEAQTPNIGSSVQGLETKISYAPITKWTQTFNARPAPERTVTFQQTSNAKVAKDDWDCGLFGSGGYYVEFDTSTSTRANLEIRSLTLQAAAGAITLTAPMAFEIKTKMHGHLDPCVGGGKGWRPRAETQKAWDTVLGLQFGSVVDGKVPYSLRLISPGELSITLQIDLGSIGTLGHPVKATGLARELMKGEFTLLFEREGTFGPLPDGQTRRYHLKTSNPTFSADGGGLSLGADVTAEILPAPVRMTPAPTGF
jgi:hypothetical protein